MNLQIKTILVTGAAGFIGASLVQKLLKLGMKVIGLDNLNNYYSPTLKADRLSEIRKIASQYSGSWDFFEIDIVDKSKLDKIFQTRSPDIVVNLAAQAGVRYSIKNPSSYIQSNLVGFGNILECCRSYNIENLVYASSSSVYGNNEISPFSEIHSVDHPISLYAATKKANELMAHSYSHLYNFSSIGLRFFTVYGPWGRPDMAPIIFARSILSNKPIKVFNYGKMKRDFTYIDDIVEGVVRCCFKKIESNEYVNQADSKVRIKAPHRVLNIGNNKPIDLLYFIEVLEDSLGVKANKKLLPIQPGDVLNTCAEIKEIESWVGFRPKTSIEKGIHLFVKWFKNYYKD
tara:strand:- start:1773 stop:2807 length:1035 start_codon:yes stop_codon:yes gene_type:complete